MQDRYTGDIGDYIKYALLRALSPGLQLGVAWYLYPDEDHNSDGKHVQYLEDPKRWRHLDPELFDGLKRIVASDRSVSSLEASGLIDAVFSAHLLDHGAHHHSVRAKSREDWFSRVQSDLTNCDLVFADPDNGLIDDGPHRRKTRKFGKQMPISEATALANGRTAVIYHHNSRFPGGHELEIDHWSRQLGSGTVAVRANAYSCRTFFIVSPTTAILERAEWFAEKWKNHRVSLHASQPRLKRAES